MTKFLDNMKFPEDIKILNNNELGSLGEEIREFLINSVSKTGGHLASNLGVVELTLSLFKSFNLEKDKIIWDVGHQSYVHKILTGRKEGFKVLRKKDGMSGFPKRNESKYDAFDTGHSSTSISAALGMARARDLKKEDYKVVAVIGDGALTGGMAIEALNDVGFNKTDMIIVLNDNQMSISPNVGGISSYLNKLRMEPGYNKLKMDINSSLGNSSVGKAVIHSLSKLKDSVKQLVVPSMLFEDMGIKYIGPIDGHDIPTMVEMFNKAKEINGPVIIHTITKKGKGYDFAEKSPWKYHGVSPFDLESGEPNISPSNSYSKAFGKSLIGIAKEDKDVVAITAAMPDGTGLRCFYKEFPDRLFDVGIAEQHAVTLAAGMACSGLKPVFAVYSTFLQRAFDQVIHDVCIQNLPVVFCIDRAGIVGDDGETHQGIMDISFLSMIPNMTIMAPKCLEEVDVLLRWALAKGTPVAIRYPRGGDGVNGLFPISKVELGKWETLNKGEKVAIIATGKMVQHALKAKKILEEKNVNPSIINATFIKPIDTDLIRELSKEGYHIVTVEDNMKNGGLGTLVLKELTNCGHKGKFVNLGYDDKFINQGNVDLLYEDNGLDGKGIADTVLKLI
ncbi:1-deoxy-D-xylulose-5-phosphate synthase [Clostridium sp.]|uniref:1-deoxy-D-xylulose-5-phosphate synthase n=1 Tax=Clostridium sp. TaxID=1506 RepID=UPI00291195D9|nr:1-deoxy-D-xylulose-5-phosphate synthase [Clostridium sp.]MDU4726685.1 1-deoxy-D-xylulose-5-phosphate synthase [Clostridium sp.]